MTAPVQIGDATLYLGDSKAVMPTLPGCSVHSIVTNPPYELGFMGKKWDTSGIANNVGLWRECLRVLKPGGHLLAFGGSRTYHRMATAIEDAGFEIRDQIMWLYSSGFPKSHNLEGDWNGWGTALKPAHEPIVVARKPLIGTVAENVNQNGTGAMNIDGCRVFTDEILQGSTVGNDIRGGAFASGRTLSPGEIPDYQQNPLGRWPANLIHDGSEEVLAEFPLSKGQQGAVTGQEPSSLTNNCYGKFNGRPATQPRGDSGSAARFFYCAKASRKDRNEGLVDPGPQFSHGNTLRKVERTETKGNGHPTVKPTELMRYLCRLVTPPGGMVLDPFMGSGSTGKAAVQEGFSFTGIEREADYFDIARARVAHAGSVATVEAVKAIETVQKEEAQHDLFSFTAA